MERNCISCRQCNRKGKPSVTKYSLYCDRNYTNIKRTNKSSIWRKILLRINIFKKLKESFIDKRFNDTIGDLNTKGFRKRYFED